MFLEVFNFLEKEKQHYYRGVDRNENMIETVNIIKFAKAGLRVLVESMFSTSQCIHLIQLNQLLSIWQ